MCGTWVCNIGKNIGAGEGNEKRGYQEGNWETQEGASSNIANTKFGEGRGINHKEGSC